MTQYIVDSIDTKLWLADAYLLRQEYSLAGESVGEARRLYRTYYDQMDDDIKAALDHRIIEMTCRVIMERY